MYTTATKNTQKRIISAKVLRKILCRSEENGWAEKVGGEVRRLAQVGVRHFLSSHLSSVTCTIVFIRCYMLLKLLNEMEWKTDIMQTA